MADIQVTCTYCQEYINGVRVQCYECQEFDICLQCFAAGAEIGTHKSYHSYRLIEHGSVSIFGGRSAWTGNEHLQLLDAAELYSYGNWDLVAKHVETRTAEECREEYTARYLNGNIGKAMWANVSKSKLIIDLIEDEGPLSPKALASLAPLDATLEEAKILGYRPHRDDFEREYNPEAEKLVAELQLEDHQKKDTQLEKALKLAIVDMYIRTLRERQRRKRIVRDYQLVAKYFDNLRRDPNTPLYPLKEKELRDRMRPFAQFLNSGEHERLIASIQRERELRHRLSELKRYRSIGLTTQEEIIHYEQHIAFQRQQIRHGKAGGSGSQVQLLGSNQQIMSTNGGVETALNSTDAKTTWPYGNDSELGKGARPADGANPSESTVVTSIWTTQVPSSNSEAAGDLRALPLSKLLSQGEVQFCSTLKMEPVTYITMKSLIIQDNLLSPGKYQNKNTVGRPENESSTDAKEEIVKFLNSNGWLPSMST